MGVNLWGDKKTKWLAVIFFLFVPLTAFSRNYLGVHTPQDVFVGITISILSLILAAKLFQYLTVHPEKEDMFLLAGFVICCLALLYFKVKPYPMEMNAEGQLIVDPQKMMNDGFGDVGKMMGFIIGRTIEKRWIKFKATGLGVKSVIICLIGLVPMWLLKTYLSPALVAALGSHWGKLLFSIIHACYYIALFPAILNIYNKTIADNA